MTEQKVISRQTGLEEKQYKWGFEFDIESDIAIIEMGASKPGEIGHICNIAKPHFGLITNIYAAHLECFGEIEEVAKTKSALFTSLPAEGMAFINLDDPFISKMEIPCNNINFSFKILEIGTW